MNLGYACINMELRKQKIFAGRTCRKDRFLKEGLPYVGELGLQNLRDLYKIVLWNEKNDIKLFRVGSDIFPWSSEYQYSELPQYEEACKVLKVIGDYAKSVGQRLSFHPGPFNILGSRNPDVVRRTIFDLNHHSEIFDLMGFEPSPYNKINIHIGAAYGDKQKVLEEWIRNFKLLHPNTQKRLTLENDDKASMFTIQDLMYVHDAVGIPLVFDYHHHTCNPGKLTHQEALALAISTWPKDIRPVVHYSSARKIEDPKAKIQAHADYIYESVNTYGFDLDIMMECKMKEKAMLQYRKKEGILI
jgi:UV DNA damage endonuclease